MQNVIQRAVILAPGEAVRAEHLQLPRAPAAPAALPEPLPAHDLKSLERSHILSTLESVGGSRRLAAQKLGMSERTLRHKLQQYREADR